MSGTIEIKKMAIRDPKIIEWLENRELYNLWEEEQKKGRKSAPKTKAKAGDPKPKENKTDIVRRATKPAPGR